MTDTTQLDSAAGKNGTLNTKDMRRILGSSFLGSAVEFYDFTLYATAASIVFNKVFFTHLGPTFALFASFATLAVGYLARPLGGVLFGHFGDLLGRKKLLVLSMLTMGVGTFAIGLLPTTAQAGIAAPVILVVLRIIQGIAVGGEWGGAALMAVEHAPAAKRGLAAAFANAGGPVGGMMGTLALSLFAAVSGKGFLEWGWRVPFLLSAVLVVVGLVIRLKVSETPAFVRLEAEGTRRRVPLIDVLRFNKMAILLGLAATTVFYSSQTVVGTWGIAVAVQHGVDQNGVLNIKSAANLLVVVLTFYSARLSDRLGRRRVLLVTVAAGIALAFPIVALVTNGTLWGFGVALGLGHLILGFLYGPIAAYVVEQFPVRNRYTGSSLAYQGASLLGAGLVPLILEGLTISGGNAIFPVGAFWIAVFLAGAAAVWFTREGTGREID